MWAGGGSQSQETEPSQQGGFARLGGPLSSVGGFFSLKHAPTSRRSGLGFGGLDEVCVFVDLPTRRCTNQSHSGVTGRQGAPPCGEKDGGTPPPATQNRERHSTYSLLIDGLFLRADARPITTMNDNLKLWRRGGASAAAEATDGTEKGAKRETDN